MLKAIIWTFKRPFITDDCYDVQAFLTGEGIYRLSIVKVDLGIDKRQTRRQNSGYEGVAFLGI
jgi:hypothetical protein